MAVDSAKLVDLLARNIPQLQISKALGISESRVSQLATDERVVELVTERQAELATAEVDSITSLETINKSLLSRMDVLAEESDSLNEVVNAYEKINRLVAQKKGFSTESEDGIRKITIQAPVFIQQNIQVNKNTNNEIISIDDRAMTTMPTTAIHKLLKSHGQAKGKDKTTDPAEF